MDCQNWTKRSTSFHHIAILLLCIILLFMFWTYLSVFFLLLIVCNFLLKCPSEPKTQKIFHRIRHSADDADYAYTHTISSFYKCKQNTTKSSNSSFVQVFNLTIRLCWMNNKRIGHLNSILWPSKLFGKYNIAYK